MKKYSEKIKNFFLKKSKGLSLMEMLIAVFIFMLITLAAVAIFSSIILMNERSRQNGIGMEEARTAMETMSKNMRMSSKVKIDGTSDKITMYNNSQKKCIRYVFTEGNILRRQEFSSSDENRCNDSGIYPGAVPMAQTPMEGEFFVDETEKELGSEAIGKATIRVKTGGEILQTTVSFRDYEGIIQ